jgi:uncharacterized protein (AIM24 family)
MNESHAIFVSKEMLERDPEFEKSLLNKAQKQQDLVVMNYDAEGTTKVLYEPKTNYKIDRIEVMVDKSNHFISETQMESISPCHFRLLQNFSHDQQN